MTWLVTTGLTNALLAGVLAVVAWLIGRSCRRPALTRLLWIIVLCKLVTPPLAKAPVGDWLAEPRQWLADATIGAAMPVGEREPAQARRLSGDAHGVVGWDQRACERRPTVSNHGSKAGHGGPALASSLFPPYLRSMAAVWFCGSVLCLVWLACRAYRFRRFLAKSARPDAELAARVVRLARDAGLASAPRVAVVESAVSPMLWGAGRNACLLFPAELTRRIDAAACDALVLHELAHYARGDWLVRLLELAVQVLYWWHPLVWWARREIEAAEEECCDAWVIHQSQSRRRYAEALLTTLDFLCEPLRPLPPAACGLGTVPLLRRRLTQIICGEVAIQPSRWGRALVLTGAAVVLPLGPAFVGPQPREALARGTPLGLATSAAIAQQATVNDLGAATVVALTSSSRPQPASWFVARDASPRVGAVVYATAVSPDGRYKLQARTGHRAALVDVGSEKSVDLSTYRIVSASFSPDSRFLATAQDDESVVRLWDCKTAVVRSLLKGSESALVSVAFAPDGRRVAAGAVDGGVLVWNMSDEEVVARLPQHDAPVSCLRWSKQSDRLAIALGTWSEGDLSSLVVWRPADGRVSDNVSLDNPAGALDWLTDD
ncbi:MAG TPA: M56 family metallopeptidase, partial [Pirellulales bacterium]|nr:M56 family metallopeptidase [Pirellulales bacterium]